MKRIHALEWEDLTWFPSSWRDFGTDYLSFLANKFDLYKDAAPFIEKAITRTGRNQWIDCASGGGSGLVRLSQPLSKKHPGLKITLTDFFPNVKSFKRTQSLNPEVFEFDSKSVDAMNVPQEHHGKLRTMFGSFHHFRPVDAQKILQNAVDTNSPIAIFEPVGKNFISWFSMLFVIPQVFILAPFIRPFRWTNLIFVYLIPIIPLFVLWDGIASILRMYSEKERLDLISNLKNHEKFNWEVGKTQTKPAPINYLVGIPK